VQIYVRTRGRDRTLDYQFAGEAPEDFWWRSYGKVTDVERPTILVRANGASWGAYIAGITSRRIDVTDNTIQFNLTLAGECGPGDENELALRIITQSAAGLAEQGGVFIPGDLLDRVLAEDEVVRLLASPGKETADAAADAVRTAYSVPAAGARGKDDPVQPSRLAASAPPDGHWIGGLSDSHAQEAFATLAAGLLCGACAGSAVALNLVEEEADLAEIPDWPGVLGVLSARPGPGLGMAVRNRGKARPPQEEEEPESEKPGFRLPGRKITLILAGALVGAAALAILIDWLVRAAGAHTAH
jgi:hypothetical protein